MRVLIVEPADDVREQLEACFRVGHYSVVGTRNAAEALDWLSENAPPDLAVLDLSPMSLTVLELLTAIRVRSRSELPLLFVSRTARPSLHFGDLGSVVTPPFEPVRVLAAADEVFLEVAVKAQFGRRRPPPLERRGSRTKSHQGAPGVQRCSRVEPPAFAAGVSRSGNQREAERGGAEGDIKAQSPRRVGVESRVPLRMAIEGAHILADEVRERLRVEGFTDDAIDRWTETFIVEEGPGEYDVEDLIRWIRLKEGLDQ